MVLPMTIRTALPSFRRSVGTLNGRLIAGAVLTLVCNLLWILGVTATGLVSIEVSLTGFCPVGLHVPAILG